MSPRNRLAGEKSSELGTDSHEVWAVALSCWNHALLKGIPLRWTWFRNEKITDHGNITLRVHYHCYSPKKKKKTKSLSLLIYTMQLGQLLFDVEEAADGVLVGYLGPSNENVLCLQKNFPLRWKWASSGVKIMISGSSSIILKTRLDDERAVFIGPSLHCD